MNLVHDQRVEVYDHERKKWVKTQVDALYGVDAAAIGFGWVCVSGWGGRAGPVSVRLGDVKPVEVAS